MNTQVRADRRVQRTRRQLREALITLILDRGWDAVSVRDVCEKADVGRSTFYVHFADKENLLLSGFDDLHAAMDDIRTHESVPFGFIEPLVLHVAEHKRLLQAVLGRQSGQQMQWRFRDVVRSLIEVELQSLKTPRAARTSVARFITGGLVELLMTWVEEPRGVSAAKLAVELQQHALAVATGSVGG
jgi:AcrR family transcriptional regulator